MPKSDEKIQVLVLAAGKGVRMGSAKPKVLHRLCGLSLLERVLRAAASLEPQKICVVVGYEQEQVREEISTFTGRLLKLTIIEQGEQKGTGHAVQVALSALGAERVLIIPGDVPLLSSETLQQFIANSAGSELSLISADVADATGFGRVLRDSKGNTQRIVEHKDCSATEKDIREINSAIYLVSKSLLSEALQSLKPNNTQKELYLTDIVGFAVAKGIPVKAIKAGNSDEALGANSISELSALETKRRKQLVELQMAGGVTFENPSAVYLDEDVKIGADSFIGAGTRLQGSTNIGANVRIEGDTLIRNCAIAAGTAIKLGCYLEDSVVGENCNIGPFARLRPETSLATGVKIGNFVEIKKSELKKGVKASHLSYIGDAVIGENSNIGAGAIFCNYDGQKKHKIVLESGVFIGSNSCLVAPLQVGKGAYVGAGSTITKDVAGGALALGRTRQTAIDGWAERKNKK